MMFYSIKSCRTAEQGKWLNRYFISSEAGKQVQWAQVPLKETSFSLTSVWIFLLLNAKVKLSSLNPLSS